MAVLSIKGPLEKAAESVDAGQLLKTAARNTLEQALGEQPTAPAKSKPVLGKMAKPSLMIAGGIAGMTAASAAVSAVRRKQEEG
jgi:hypothetical protein